MNGYLLVAMLLIGISASLATYELACSWCGTKRVSSAVLPLSSRSEEASSSYQSAEKVLIGRAMQRVSTAVNAFAPMTHDEASATRERLRRAGMGIEPETWRMLVALAAVASAAVCFVVCSLCAVAGLWKLALMVGAAVAGYYLAQQFLTIKQKNRCRDIEASLPDAMELLAVALAAGSPLEQCFREVAASLKGPIAEELRLVDQEVNLLGRSRTEALEHLAQRCASQEVSSFVGQITQSIDQGSSVSEGLAVQALLAREQAQAAALERIRKMPTKLDIVLSACFLPPTVMLVLIPTVVKLLAFFNGGMV